ncbi:ABC transporter G family member 9-like isoform X2 [Arachis duranensis]|uniref:ABC transporter G family member 9-like isoform X2 n=1 Tax=Arachis duranensis TaxID=130453 RepID=A0A9C6TXB8_ARADU|nr:ABC transporter G family member 9-like isoform X2 [Arachis duranensis]
MTLRVAKSMDLQLDIETEATHHANLPVLLKFYDVVYKTKPEKERFIENTKVEGKTILKGVSGIVQPGEILAMLGPSGSGKTTLLTALGGRLGGKLSGNITYNGKTFSNAMKRLTGFVTQDDVLYPHLTVTETLIFTARLRLPSSRFTKEEKIMQAKNVIDQLGLTECKDSMIGGPCLRGVSGGERKRVSIGQEMLINPSLLLLDEPTSGLDSTTAQKIVSTLSELASDGEKTIVMTIHQPSSRIYYLFHKVLLLSEGNLMYFGMGSEAVKYFSSIDYAPSMDMNPSDFLLDLANGIYTGQPNEDHTLNKKKLISSYKEHFSDTIEPMFHEKCDFDKNEDRFEDEKSFGTWPTSWWQQFFLLLRRDVKERRHESFSCILIFEVIAAAIITGLVWYKSDISHLQDQLGLLYNMINFWFAFPLYRAIFTFPQERPMLEKERSSGLKVNAVNFLCTLSTVLLHVLVAQGVGLAIGAIVMDMKSVTTLAAIIMLIFMLSAGYFVQHLPKFMAWLKYISPSYYTYLLLIGSQYKSSETYPCSNSNGECSVAEFPMIRTQMVLDMKEQAMAALALVIMLIGYRIVAYIALLRIGVTKNKA